MLIAYNFYKFNCFRIWSVLSCEQLSVRLSIQTPSFLKEKFVVNLADFQSRGELRVHRCRCCLSHRLSLLMIRFTSNPVWVSSIGYSDVRMEGDLQVEVQNLRYSRNRMTGKISCKVTILCCVFRNAMDLSNLTVISVPNPVAHGPRLTDDECLIVPSCAIRFRHDVSPFLLSRGILAFFVLKAKLYQFKVSQSFLLKIPPRLWNRFELLLVRGSIFQAR